jgi:hypothetical protein
MTVEQVITVTSLIIVAIFYVFTIAVFLAARKNALNYALAMQKICWVLLIIGIALPSYSGWYAPLSMPWRAVVWVCISLCSLWVMYAVYRANWSGSMATFFKWLWCSVTRTCHRAQQNRPTV